MRDTEPSEANVPPPNEVQNFADRNFDNTSSRDARREELDFDNIFIADVSESSIFQESASLLGRDFLNLCDLRLNHAQNLVALTPLNVDAGGIILPP